MRRLRRRLSWQRQLRPPGSVLLAASRIQQLLPLVRVGCFGCCCCLLLQVLYESVPWRQVGGKAPATCRLSLWWHYQGSCIVSVNALQPAKERRAWWAGIAGCTE